MKKTLLPLFFVFYMTSSIALTGSQLNEYCGGSVDFQTFCKGYILGSAEGLGVMNSVDEHFAPNAAIKKLFCVPPGLAPNDLTDVVKKYLNENPQDRGQPASFVVLLSLGKAFPCK